MIHVLRALASRLLALARGAWPMLAVMAIGAHRLSAQVVQIRGTVVDSATAVPIGGVHVALIPVGHRSATETALTAEDGRFALLNPPSFYELVFSRIGYAPLRVRLEGSAAPIRVKLAALEVPLEPVVVSVSRSEQTALDAPAALSVLDRSDVARAVGFTPLDQLADLPGVDVARKGLLQSEFAVRGASGVNSAGLLMLTDSRYAEVPSIGFNIPYLLPTTREDVERIEVVRGPGAALYGPGAARGVLHVITRSPFESPGGTMSVTVGERSVAQGSFRYAATLGSRLAFAVSGDYFHGHDWEFRDTTEDRSRRDALAAGALADTLRIAQRDFRLGRGSAELRVDWRPGPATSVVARAGAAEALRAIDLTSEIAAVQVRDWRYSFLQATVRHARLFANIQYDLSNAGSTYALRTGDPLVDYSRMAAGHLQDGVSFGAIDLLYGADVRWTDPRTGGTIDGAYEGHDQVTETGAYAHAATRLSRRFDLVTALRVDRHNRLNDLVVSPRAALVFKPGRGHALRLTFNRAFSSPDPSDLFADILAERRFGGLPYDARAASIPQHGFSFRRDCGGLCMRSPLNPAGAGQYLPAEATQFWSEIVEIAKQYVDVSSIPQPTPTQVGTVLGALNPQTLQFDPVAPGDIRDVPALRRTITSSLELGYRGIAAGRYGVALDLYWNRVLDPLGDRYTLTPNALLDPVTLGQYLGNYMPASAAAQAAAVLAQIPAGTITPSQAPHPVDLLFVRSQGGRYTFWGADLSISAAFGGGWSTAASVSWVSTNSVGEPGTTTGLLLNIPRTKGTLSLRYRRGPWAASLRGRAVSEFPVASGWYYKGHVAAYGLMDAAIDYRLTRGSETTFTLDAQNVLDHRHVEMVGAPPLGRLVVGRLRLML